MIWFHGNIYWLKHWLLLQWQVVSFFWFWCKNSTHISGKLPCQLPGRSFCFETTVALIFTLVTNLLPCRWIVSTIVQFTCNIKGSSNIHVLRRSRCTATGPYCQPWCHRKCSQSRNRKAIVYSKVSHPTFLLCAVIFMQKFRGFLSSIASAMSECNYFLGFNFDVKTAPGN